jgi:hypothetical protein
MAGPNPYHLRGLPSLQVKNIVIPVVTLQEIGGKHVFLNYIHTEIRIT